MFYVIYPFPYAYCMPASVVVFYFISQIIFGEEDKL